MVLPDDILPTLNKYIGLIQKNYRQHKLFMLPVVVL